MHRKINRFSNRKKRLIESYIAYRLPYDTTVHTLKGNGTWIDQIDQLKKTGILFHSFSGKHILYIENLIPINKSAFKTYERAPESKDQSREDYAQNFQQLKEAIHSGKFKKVILSRTHTVNCSKSALEIFDLLNKQYGNTFNYVISHPEIGTWLGATPERLLSIDGTKLQTMSLAGTKMAAENWTEKEKEEQQLVTDTIIYGLKLSGCIAIRTLGPSTIDAAKIQHLKTEISAQLVRENNWHKVLKTLHPTPAVCGIPTHKAKQFIPKLEGYDRKFYTGYIGILNDSKKDFFVNLRCMEYHGSSARLYVGGGITAPSMEEREWEETQRKASTLTDIIQRKSI